MPSNPFNLVLFVGSNGADLFPGVTTAAELHHFAVLPVARAVIPQELSSLLRELYFEAEIDLK